MTNKKTIKRIYNTIVILILLAGVAYVCSRFVHFGNVEYTDDARVDRHIVPVNTRVQGFIKEIRFEDYDRVRKGDTLVIIDDSEYRLRVAQAEADLERTLSGKSTDAAGLKTIESNVTVFDSGIEEASENLRNAESDYSRYKALLAKDAVTRQQYDAVETRYKTAKARYEQVLRQRNSASLSRNEQTGRLGQSTAMVDVSLSSATGSAWLSAPVNNATGNFVKVNREYLCASS